MTNIIIAADNSTLNDAIKLSEDVFKSKFMSGLTLKEDGFKPSNVRLLYHGAKLASSITVIPREMYFDGVFMPLAGIGGVATSPECRGKGYANSLMKDAIKYMAEEGYGLSVLYPFKADYYARFGYREILTPHKIINKEMAADPGEYVIKNVSARDFAALNNIYERFSAGKTGMVRRNLNYWRNTTGFRKGEYRITGAFYKNKLSAYAVISPLQKAWTENPCAMKLIEFGCLFGHESASKALLNAALTAARENGFNAIFYDDCRAMEAFPGRKPDAAQTKQYKNLKQIKMFRICNFKVFMKILSELFAGRMRKAGAKGAWNDYLAISRDVRELQPVVTVRLIKEKKIMRFDEGDFLKLALGYKAGKGVLKFFFPALRPVFWDFDYL